MYLISKKNDSIPLMRQFYSDWAPHRVYDMQLRKKIE